MEWHGAIAIYVIGTLALIISAVHTAVTSQEKGILMNGFELEKNLDEKKYRQVKTLLLALQCSDCRQSGARTVVLAPFFSVCSNRSPKMIKKSILSSLSYRFFEASLLVFLDSCRQR